MMSKLKLAAALALTVVVATGWVAAPAEAQALKAEYKVSTVVGPPFPWGLAAQRWADVVKDENGFRELTNSKRAIRSPDDLKGLKIRVVGSPLFNDTFTALGANPTQMSWADAQPALSTGAVDGQENPLTIFTVAKLHTVGQKH